jgi:hypothetical protein
MLGLSFPSSRYFVHTVWRVNDTVFRFSAVHFHKIDAYSFTVLLTLSLYRVASLPVSCRLHGELKSVVRNMHDVPVVRIPLVVGDMAFVEQCGMP